MSETTKRWTKNIVAIATILSVASFALVFLLGLAYEQRVSNFLSTIAPLRLDGQSRWAEIPGALNYTMTRRIELYNLLSANTQNSTMTLESQPPVTLDSGFVLNDITWEPQHDLLKFNTSYTSANSDFDLDGQVMQVNFDALSVWHQMNDKPHYWLAWQALSQISHLMYKDLQIYNRFYAWNAHQWLLNDKSLVREGVIPMFNTSQQDILINDSRFGLGKIEGLTIWFSACQNNTGAYDVLVANFALKGIDLNATVMQQIIGPGSLIRQAYNTLVSQIASQPDFNRTGSQTLDMSATQMTQLQWAQTSFLGNPFIFLKGISPLKSCYDEAWQFTKLFLNYPEYGYFVLNTPGFTIDALLSLEQAGVLLDPDNISGYQTLLNPDNMRAFYQYFDSDDFLSIYSRFNLTSKQQIDALHQYFALIIQKQLEMQGNQYAFTAYGSLQQKALSQSYQQILVTLPLELETRYLSMNLTTNGLNCTYYISQVALTFQTQEICGQYNFSDVNDLRLFVNATWYNGTYQEQLERATGLNQQQIWKLYDTQIPTSLGTAILQQCKWISTSFGCSNQTNCSAVELASLQWGSSFITLNPPVNNATYCPKTNTMSNWGAYTITSMPQPAEFFYYSQLYSSQQQIQATPLNQSQVELILDSDTNSFGLNSMYNSARFAFAQISSYQQLLQLFQTNLQISNCAYLFYPLRFMVQNYLLGNAYDQYDQKDLIAGFYGQVAYKVNGGSFAQGADFSLTNAVTPVINNLIGTLSTQQYEIKPGDSDLKNIGELRYLNGVSYLNKKVYVYNGRFNQTVMQATNSVSFKNSSLINSTFGLQFTPRRYFKQSDASKTVFNARTLTNDKYFYKRSHWEDQGLFIDTYEMDFTRNAQNISLAFNLPVSEFGLGCYDCSSVLNLNKLIVNNKPYKDNQSQQIPSKLEIEAESGILYSYQRASTMMFTLECNTNYICISLPFPDFDVLFESLPNGVQQRSFPIYNYEENLLASKDMMLSELQPKIQDYQKMANFTVSLTAVGSCLLGLAIAATLYYWSVVPIQNKKSLKQPQRKHRVETEDDIDVDAGALSLDQPSKRFILM